MFKFVGQQDSAVSFGAYLTDANCSDLNSSLMSSIVAVFVTDKLSNDAYVKVRLQYV